MAEGYRNNQFGTDLLAQYLELWLCTAKRFRRTCIRWNIKPTNSYGARCFIRRSSIFRDEPIG